jgi:hypothetical protein
MKFHTTKSRLGLAAAAVLAVSSIATAQQVTVTESSTTNYGTVSQYAPGQTLVVTRETGGPLNYTVTKETTFVDETGAPVVAERVTTGVPITVHYVRQGDSMVASRVIVKKTTTTAPAPAPVRVTPPVTETTRSTTTTTTPVRPLTEDEREEIEERREEAKERREERREEAEDRRD